jgi:hypothetical protein
MTATPPFSPGVFGQPVLISVNATEPGPAIKVRRSWRERCLTRPWRPWRSVRWHIPMIPTCYQLPDGTLVMHPEYASELRRAIGGTKR